MRSSTGKVGAVGFCWGGGMVNRVAVLSPDLKAGVAYYGVAAAGREGESDPVRRCFCIMPGSTSASMPGFPAYEAALKAAGKRFTIHVYPNVNHAFNNDTGNRYDKPAADLAWSRTIAFFKENLGAPPRA